MNMKGDAIMITKEKNIITFIRDDGQVAGKFDINTGIFYGITGNVLKNLSPYIIEIIECNHKDCAIIDYCFNRYGDSAKDFKKAMSKNALYLDKLLNIGIPGNKITLQFFSCEYFDSMISNKKFIDLVKSEESTYCFSNSHYESFLRHEEFDKILIENGNTLEDFYYDVLFDVYAKSNKDKSYINFCIKAITSPTNHMDISIDYMNDYIDMKKTELVNIFIAYYHACKNLKRKYDYKNFWTDFIRVIQLNKIYLAEKENSIFRSHTDKAILSYSNEKFVVVCPEKVRDLVTEGHKMHHCVGSYGNKVISGKVTIVFVRRKEDITKPYITCEIYPNGSIGQYFMAYDKYIGKEEDIVFRQEYQKYLYSKSKEIEEMLSR